MNNHHLLRQRIRYVKHLRLQRKMNVYIAPNCFGYGLRLEHPFGIFVNSKARIGNYANIHQMVTIGNNGKTNDAATIGDNCYIGANSVIVGEIILGDNIVVGAGSVVTKNFASNKTIVGVPAREIMK